MKIKEIRDFKQLPLVEQKEKLQKTKLWLSIITIINLASASCGIAALVQLSNLYKGYSTSHNFADFGIAFLFLFAATSGITIGQYEDYIQQDTIIKLEEDELTRERTL